MSELLVQYLETVQRELACKDKIHVEHWDRSLMKFCTFLPKLMTNYKVLYPAVT